jgi:hypothetical protein
MAFGRIAHGKMTDAYFAALPNLVAAFLAKPV